MVAGIVPIEDVVLLILIANSVSSNHLLLIIEQSSGQRKILLRPETRHYVVMINSGLYVKKGMSLKHPSAT